MLEVIDASYKDFLIYPHLTFAGGQTTFLMGKSGSGKTTLFKLLNKTAQLEAGQILYKNQDSASIDPLLLRREVLLVSQSPFLFDDTIKANFTAFFGFRQLQPLSDEQIRTYLELVCLDFSLDKQCDELSGGERQRGFIAIHLSLRPMVLLLDEPTAALDEQTGEKLISNIIAYCQREKITPIIISHSQLLSSKFADKIIDLDQGDN